jgi:hypothetical protein
MVRRSEPAANSVRQPSVDQTEGRNAASLGRLRRVAMAEMSVRSWRPSVTEIEKRAYAPAVGGNRSIGLDI